MINVGNVLSLGQESKPELAQESLDLLKNNTPRLRSSIVEKNKNDLYLIGFTRINLAMFTAEMGYDPGEILKDENILKQDINPNKKLNKNEAENIINCLDKIISAFEHCTNEEQQKNSLKQFDIQLMKLASCIDLDYRVCKEISAEIFTYYREKMDDE